MKKSFAFDKRFLCFVFIIVIPMFVSYLQANKKEFMVMAVLALIASIVALNEPNYYVADSDGVTIYRFLFIKKHYKWDEIERIRLNIERGYKRKLHNVYLLIPKKTPYHNTHWITKSTATKRLIKMYWKDKIIGDEDIDYEKELEKQNRKLKASNEKLLVKAESEARTRIDEAIKVYKTKAKQQGKFVKTKYVYEIDSKECKDRPVCSYSFAVNIEVGKAGENASVFGVIKLLSVSRKEDKNKVNENKNAVSEIRKFLIDNIEK